VGTVGPVVELGIHHMAVNAGFRIVAQVGWGSRYIDRIRGKSEENSQ